MPMAAMRMDGWRAEECQRFPADASVQVSGDAGRCGCFRWHGLEGGWEEDGGVGA